MNRLSMASMVLTAVAALAFDAVSAGAADMPPSLPPPHRATVSYTPVFGWNGAYVGLNFGYGLGSSNWTASTGGTTGTFAVRGAFAGGTLGYNMQFGSWVFGGETDFDWSGIKGSSSNAVCTTTCETRNNWLGTLRGRFGYSYDRFMSYLTGGLAYGGMKVTGAGGAATATKVGWTLGGGTEMSFGGGWTGKLEYLYVDLGKTNCDASCSGGVPFEAKFNAHLIRGGVNYRF